MSLAAAMIASRSGATVTAGGIRWTIRIPSTRDLLAVGGVGVIAAVPAEDAQPPDLSGSSDVDSAARSLAQIDALVCASVTAALPDGADGDAEALELVPDQAREDAAAGRVWVESLTPAVRGELAAGIVLAIQDGGRLARAAATFRGRA